VPNSRHHKRSTDRRASRLTLLALILAFLTGACLRFASLDRAFWIDEAWVLNSVQTPTIGAMLDYEGWAQTTPPGVLFVLRSLNGLAVQHKEIYRVPSIVCGVLSLLLIGVLARRFCSIPFVLLTTLFVAINPLIAWYSTEVKQYSFDFLAAVVFLLMGSAFIRRPTPTMLWAWGAACAFSVFFSYTILVFLPVLILVSATMYVGRRRQAEAAKEHPSLRFVDLVFANLLPGAAGAFVYVYMILPQANLPAFERFWSANYYASSGASLAFYVRSAFGEMFAVFPGISATPAGIVGLLTVAATGLYAAVQSTGNDVARKWALSFLLALPVIVLAVLNALEKYPVREFRLTFFLIPGALLVLALGLEQFARGIGALWERLGTRSDHQTTSVALLGVALNIVVLVAFLPDRVWNWKAGIGEETWESRGDIRPTMDAIDVLTGSLGFLYVHAGAREVFNLYREPSLADGVTLIFGQTQSPCCIPGIPYSRDVVSPTEMDKEMSRVLARTGRASFYMLLPTWRRIDKADYLDSLARRSCASNWSSVIHGYILIGITCTRAE
jgi:hypothetical protein